jgi:hypothetical protein
MENNVELIFRKAKEADIPSVSTGSGLLSLLKLASKNTIIICTFESLLVFRTGGTLYCLYEDLSTTIRVQKDNI